MIYRTGIYVFESKNYSGWIFANENAKNWTQTLPSGRKAHKEHFFNPIIQNKVHIKWLKNLIGEQYPIHSVIVFSVRCTLKKVEVHNKDVLLVKRDKLRKALKMMDSKLTPVLNQEQIDKLYEVFYAYTQVTAEVKKKHIEDVKQIQNDDVTFAADQTTTQMNYICPKCGGKLIPRTTKKGANAGNQFWGCCNFPKCRYIQKR